MRASSQFSYVHVAYTSTSAIGHHIIDARRSIHSPPHNHAPQATWADEGWILDRHRECCPTLSYCRCHGITSCSHQSEYVHLSHVYMSGVTITHFRISGFFRLLLFTFSAFSQGPNDISEIDQSSIATAGTPLRFQIIF